MSATSASGIERTIDAFHRGSFEIVQPRSAGHRSGLDAMLLASAVPSTLAGTVADLGAGSGAAALAVLARCPSTLALLVEREPVMCDLARETLALPANMRLALRACIIEADVELRGRSREAAGLHADSCDFAIMNPPFNPAEDRATPDALRGAAHVMPEGLLESWVRTASAIVKPGGGVALIARPQTLAEMLNALAGRFGAIDIVPVAPRPGAPAIRVIIRARKGSRRPLALMPALVLHGPDGNSFLAVADDLINGRTSLFGD